ncbi:asparagine synthase (glutamine-hydrolyzing) [Pseudochryseolinea flava]|uniref:asparagine synthase (glutamine-hydrolyzing) n=1 Tax=Pseudochryseolinea flava TaxID=2059302 RepID=A0A364Y6D2_9BACT|nr:asparagine synthase (glutamine-hydrolyzing) [Pseudochryseolinea flava]RAW02654.1 asparagine synthase (glutamine-hydrolyzing) [Pseudochryseolinea flava]
MCGIAGVINFSTEELLPGNRHMQFTKCLQYRGPDDQGDWQYRDDKVNVSLFHARLSIIDLQPTGHQPMLDREEEIAIVFNGEIYNYKLLREQLLQAGFSFQSSSDTEVLIHGYRYWGFEKLMQLIDGMFAIMLFDKRTHQTWLARDRFGKKPLLYARTKEGLIVSSDVRSFQAIPSLSLTINYHSLGYFLYEFSSPGEHTIWNEVKKLPAGYFAKFDASGLTKQQYWKLDFSSSNNLPWTDTVERAEELLREAVRKRLVADVPVSAQLSGGIDSSLVVAMMAGLQSGPVKTYNVSFDDESIDESKYAKLVAERFGTDHTEIKLSQMDLGLIDDIIAEYGEPFADTSMLPTYLVCKEISKTEKVVCGGDGGDELFAGYHINHFVNKLDSVKHLGFLKPFAHAAARIAPSYRLRLLKQLLDAARKDDYMLLHRNMSFSIADMSRLTTCTEAVNATTVEHRAIWDNASKKEESLSKNLLATFLHTRLVNDYLVKVDRASMFASLEMRSPFLDRDLASFAATLTRNDLFAAHGTKSVLKAIAEKYFPKNFVHRHKMGFGVPMAQWFRQDLEKKFRERVLEGKQKYIDLDYTLIAQLLAKHKSGEDHAEKLWALYVFHTWAQENKF